MTVIRLLKAQRLCLCVVQYDRKISGIITECCRRRSSCSYSCLRFCSTRACDVRNGYCEGNCSCSAYHSYHVGIHKTYSSGSRERHNHCTNFATSSAVTILTGETQTASEHCSWDCRKP